MREFKLINAIGQVYNLNDIKSFFHSPKGLGVEFDNEFEQIGNQFLLTEEGMKQPEPEGKIRFENYQSFNKFAKFLQRTPLKLQYTAADKYCMNVLVKKIEKTELETLGLVITIKFSGLSQWYKDIVKNIDGPDAVGKVYSYGYPYIYADASQGVISIESDSEMESPVILTIIGPCSNPSYTHYVNGVPVASGKIICNIPEGHRICISSQIPYSINELDSLGNFIEDLYPKSDFSTQRFLMIQNGTNEIAFLHDGQEEIKAIVEAMIYYETV